MKNSLNLDLDNLNIGYRLEILSNSSHKYVKISGKITQRNFDKLCFTLSNLKHVRHLDISDFEIPENSHGQLRQSIPKKLVSLETGGKLNRGKLYENIKGNRANLERHVDSVARKIYNYVRIPFYLAFCAALSAIDYSFLNVFRLDEESNYEKMFKELDYEKIFASKASNFMKSLFMIGAFLFLPNLIHGAIRLCTSIFNRPKDRGGFYELSILDGKLAESSIVKQIDLRYVKHNLLERVDEYFGYSREILRHIDKNREIFTEKLIDQKDKHYLYQQTGYAQDFYKIFKQTSKYRNIDGDPLIDGLTRKAVLGNGSLPFNSQVLLPGYAMNMPTKVNYSKLSNNEIRNIHHRKFTKYYASENDASKNVTRQRSNSF